MAIDLGALLDPRHCALITSECQNGIIGPSTSLPALNAAVEEAGLRPQLGKLAAAARAAAVPVLHGVVHHRADRRGASANCLLLAASHKGPAMLPGSEAVRVVDELAQADSDYLVPRLHGVSLFHDSELDSILRSLGVRTIVLTGISVNVALMGTTIEAVNRGYQVVIPRDAVAGVPMDYARQVLENSLRVLATLSSVEKIASIWQSAAARAA